jgi:hypothetical protein
MPLLAGFRAVALLFLVVAAGSGMARLGPEGISRPRRKSLI